MCFSLKLISLLLCKLFLLFLCILSSLDLSLVFCSSFSLSSSTFLLLLGDLELFLSFLDLCFLPVSTLKSVLLDDEGSWWLFFVCWLSRLSILWVDSRMCFDEIFLILCSNSIPRVCSDSILCFLVFTNGALWVLSFSLWRWELEGISVADLDFGRETESIFSDFLFVWWCPDLLPFTWKEKKYYKIYQCYELTYN